MKILKYITAVFALIFVIASCEKEVTNPELTDTDYRVYFWGSGENAYNIARQGFDVILGESLEIKLMNSPSDGTDVKWVLASDSSLINKTMNYTFTPEVEGLQKTWFVSSRSSGFTDTVTFNLRGVTDGIVRDAKSEMAVWQNFEYPQGSINGSFTAEFDMVAEKNNTNCITGFQQGEASGFGDLSAILRFTTAGNFDARNGTEYTFDNEVKYSAGLNYHVRMEIDALNMKYDVFITDVDGLETQLADDYAFRKQVSDLSHWSVIADNWETPAENQGYHTISNMNIYNVKQNVLPVFSEFEDVTIYEGGTQVVTVRAKDPLGGIATIEAGDNFPRFAKLVDNGNGSATITLEPYENCGGCDLGDYDLSIIATNEQGATEGILKVSVVEFFLDVIADKGDGTVFANGDINDVYIINYAGHHGMVAYASTILPILIPESPEGKTISSAELSVYINNNVSWMDLKYDLYALGIRDTPTVLATDHYAGIYGGDLNATPIQEGFIGRDDPVDPNGTPVNRKSSEQGSLALGEYLKTQMEQGDVSGKYLFVRISINRDNVDAWNLLQLISSDGANESQHPMLRIKY